MTQQPTSPLPDESPMDKAETTGGRAVHTSTRTPLYEAYNSARYERQELIRQIQAQTKRRLISYVSGNGRRIDRDDTMPFVDLLYQLSPGENVEIMLHTLGGSVDSAEKLMRLVRSKVSDGEIYIVVPEYAKSAGTLMVLGADCVVMSDTSELGPIDPQRIFYDSHGAGRWQPVQNYLDAYHEHRDKVSEDPNNVVSQIMLGKLDSEIVKLCESERDRARQSAEYLLKRGMFRLREGSNFTKTVELLLDTNLWRSHGQMISWQEVHDLELGLIVEYIDPHLNLWQQYWKLYCLQRLAVGDNEKLYESDCVSLVIDGPTS